MRFDSRTVPDALRVLVLRHGYYPADPRVYREVRALVARGHAVDVVCLRDAGERAREVVGGVHVTRLPLGHRRAGVLRYLGEYGASFAGALLVATWRHLRRRYDVVQANTMPDVLVFAALVPKLLGARVLLDLHELMPELYASKFGVDQDHPLPRVLACAERASVGFADACLAVSQPCLDRYVARGAPPGKFTVVMNTADPVLFERPARVAVRPDAFRVVSHGTLVERYGFDVLIRAVASLPGACLDIVGDGEARPSLEQLVAGLGVSERVTFAGRVPLGEVPRRLAAADVGVVANRSDPFTDLVVPTKLMEYVALGVPAVVARTPAVEAYFDESAVAYFCPGDADDLAGVLGGVLGDPPRRASMVARADAAFGARYGGPVMSERYVDRVERLAREGV